MDEMLNEQNTDRLVEDLSIEATEFMEVGDFVNAQSLIEQVKLWNIRAAKDLQNQLDAIRKTESEY